MIFKHQEQQTRVLRMSFRFMSIAFLSDVVTQFAKFYLIALKTNMICQLLVLIERLTRYNLLFLSLHFSFPNASLSLPFEKNKKFIITEQTFPVSLIISMTRSFVDLVGFCP